MLTGLLHDFFSGACFGGDAFILPLDKTITKEQSRGRSSISIQDILLAATSAATARHKEPQGGLSALCFYGMKQLVSPYSSASDESCCLSTRGCMETGFEGLLLWRGHSKTAMEV